MNALATAWTPTLNPIGIGSITALVLAIFFLILADHSRFEGIQFYTINTAGITFLLFLFISAAPLFALDPLDILNLKYRRFPNVNDYIGNYIIIAIGFILALRLIKNKKRYSGTIFVSLFAILIFVEFIGLLHWRFSVDS